MYVPNKADLDPLNIGIRKALRGEAPTSDSSLNPDEWSAEKIQRAQRQRERIEDIFESGAWPMPLRPS